VAVIGETGLQFLFLLPLAASLSLSLPRPAIPGSHLEIAPTSPLTWGTERVLKCSYPRGGTREGPPQGCGATRAPVQVSLTAPSWRRPFCSTLPLRIEFLSRSPLVAAPGVLATAPLSDYVPALRTPPLRRLLSMLPGPTAAGSGRGVSDRPACRGLLAGRLRADVGVTPAYQYCVCVALLGATRTPGNLVA